MCRNEKAVMLPMNIQLTTRRVLHSWKEISNYTGRGVRTIQRYEVQLGFPIHRPAGSPRSAVLAFSDEVDAWLNRSPMRASHTPNMVSIDSLYEKAKLGTQRAELMHKRLESTAQLLNKLNDSMLKAMERRSRYMSALHPRVYIASTSS